MCPQVIRLFRGCTPLRATFSATEVGRVGGAFGSPLIQSAPCQDPSIKWFATPITSDSSLALEKLPDKDREILRLVAWECLSREQVAAMFFVSRSAIDQRISRAYKRLGRTLGVPEREPRTAPVPADEGGEA
jgi:predicted DNA-binding protein (UPF0251 family)